MIRRQVIMPVTPERLWDALTDPDEMVGWFGARVEWHLEPGAPARFHGDDGSERAGRVEAVRPTRHLRFRWWPAAQTDPRHGSERPDPWGGREPSEVTEPSEASEVSFVLEPVPDGTRLTIQEQQVRPSPPAPASTAQARASASGGQWTAWDGRLITAWAGLVTPAFEGAHV
jgi:uncharacterized protein YndB with AHSA1/START domain